MENIWDCQDNGECDMQSIKSEENDCWVLVYMQNHKPLNTHTHTHTTWEWGQIYQMMRKMSNWLLIRYIELKNVGTNEMGDQWNF